jgi:hypothetical protein
MAPQCPLQLCNQDHELTMVVKKDNGHFINGL